MARGQRMLEDGAVEAVVVELRDLVARHRGKLNEVVAGFGACEVGARFVGHQSRVSVIAPTANCAGVWVVDTVTDDAKLLQRMTVPDALAVDRAMPTATLVPA